eukprot:351694-Chlamydomonas_euryale.AAC.4
MHGIGDQRYFFWLARAGPAPSGSQRMKLHRGRPLIGSRIAVGATAMTAPTQSDTIPATDKRTALSRIRGTHSVGHHTSA